MFGIRDGGRFHQDGCSLSGEDGAEEIVQTAAFALLSIYIIIKEDGAGATCYSGIRVFAFAYQGPFKGFEGELFDFCNQPVILRDVVVQQQGNGATSGMVGAGSTLVLGK